MGVGDDAAVVNTQAFSVTSTDVVVDGVHFRSELMQASDIGWRAVAVALSDIAAMGAGPGEIYVAAVLPQSFDKARSLELVDGMVTCAESFGFALAGGDTVVAPQLAICVTATGWTESADRLVQRSGARTGDLIGVTGSLGGGGGGLALLERRAKGPIDLLHRFTQPQPRLTAGQELAGAGVSAMIDLSDGLASDLPHIASASGVGFSAELERLPLATGLAEVATQLEVPVDVFAASAGDDYELCFTAPPDRKSQVESAADVTWIGEVVELGAGPGFTRDGASLDLAGYEHKTGSA